jgi:hypothetical protein
MAAEIRPIERLGKLLYEEMEHLDPGAGDYIDWDSLTDRQRDFYLLLVGSLLSERELVLEILEMHG